MSAEAIHKEIKKKESKKEKGEEFWKDGTLQTKLVKLSKLRTAYRPYLHAPVA